MAAPEHDPAQLSAAILRIHTGKVSQTAIASDTAWTTLPDAFTASPWELTAADTAVIEARDALHQALQAYQAPSTIISEAER